MRRDAAQDRRAGQQIAVPVAEIAREAEVSEKTVFNYFPTKEDLVFWRLESFEDDLLSAVRDREAGESMLDAFGRFVMRRRGLLAAEDPEATERLAAITRMIVSSPPCSRASARSSIATPRRWRTSSPPSAAPIPATSSLG